MTDDARLLELLDFEPHCEWHLEGNQRCWKSADAYGSWSCGCVVFYCQEHLVAMNAAHATRIIRGLPAMTCGIHHNSFTHLVEATRLKENP